MEMKPMPQPVKKRGVPHLGNIIFLLCMSASLLLLAVGHRKDEAKRVEIAAFVAEERAFLTKAHKDIDQLTAKTKAKAKWTSADWKRFSLIKSKLLEYKARRAELCK